MKKLLLSMAVVAMLFSCSKDNVNTETETTADLTQMTPSKSLDQSSDGLYVGVFGHNEIKDLHGKITVNSGNNGNYTAIIEMVNGEKINFKGNSLNKTNVHFTSDRGSFDFNTVDFSAPEATNVFIDNQTESYIVTRKRTTRGGGGLILLGTYEETGNETGFYGNFDMIGDGIPLLPSPLVEAIDVMIVSHKGNRGPFLDFGSDLQPPGSCTEPFPGCLIDWQGTGPFSTVSGIGAFGQTSTIAGLPLTWGITTDGNLDYFTPPCTNSGPTVGGDWSWAGRSGKIYINPVAPSVAGAATQSSFDTLFNN